MSDKVYLLIGTAGSIISVAGNLPMLFNLYKTKDSTGQSLNAWYVWEIANVMLLIYAIHINDVVFSILQIAWIVFCATIISLVIKYKRVESKK
jgi:uncharacterized protein with PQ loop repeat